MSDIRVSVIIPAFKVADTLEKAVQSVLDQTEQSFEILIVDDCSPDETFAVAQALAAKDSRIRALRMPQNGGKPIVMNYATKEAKGRWIAILDGDDWYEPNRLKRLIDAGEAEGVEMVADNQYFFDIDTHQRTRTAFPRGADHKLGLDAFLEGSNPLANFDYGMLKPVFRADFILRHRIDYYEPARNGQDYYILLCFFVAGGRALVLDEPMYNYVPPSGILLRQMAREGRTRYNYDLMQQVHAHFTALFHDRLTTRQRALLAARADGLAAMMRYNQLRGSLQARNPMAALKLLATTPPKLLPKVAHRALRRIPTVLGKMVGK